MKVPALVVDRSRGEAARRALVAAGALRTDLAIVEDGSRLAFPLRDGGAVPPGWGTVEPREFPARPEPGPSDFRQLLGWTAPELEAVPRSFDVVGDVVLIRLPVELEPRRGEIGEALLRFVPGARLVGLDRGVRGDARRRTVERIAGTGGWATRHRENGLELDVDLELAYFSPRLAREHARVAAEVVAGEAVYDLCCGVGPFAVTIAREGRARSIVAVDANPEAIALLGRTLARYRLEGRVAANVGRVEQFASTAPAVDRVVLNLPREGIKYAALVAPLVLPGGSLTYYEVVPRESFAGRADEVARALGPGGGWSVNSVRVVHPYSPSSDLVAVSARRGGA